MKIIRNTSMQGLSIPFATPKGVTTLFLAPKKRVEVPNEWKSRVAENLVHRRMVKMTVVADSAPVTPQNPVKRTRLRKSIESE
tara:strand:+ start:3094 stop:3342 length:249 start_codon:yes stop_codon:yes gene_type:complete